MEFKAKFMEKLCVIYIFFLFQLSLRVSIEVSLFCVPFKQFFFQTSFLISSLDFRSRIHCYLSTIFPTRVKVEIGLFLLTADFQLSLGKPAIRVFKCKETLKPHLEKSFHFWC